MSNTCEVVISRYSENIQWITHINKNVVIYNKGNDMDVSCIKLNNVGRESHTFLTHILKNYNNIKDSTFFLQGNPFDHCRNIINIINEFKNTQELVCLSDNIFEESPFFGLEGGPGSFNLIKDSRSNPNYKGPILNDVAASLGLINCNIFKFSLGAQYIVPKNLILNKSFNWWLKALEIHQSFYHAPWFYERLWYSIFNYDEIN